MELDDSQLCGEISLRLKDRRAKAEEIERLKYELSDKQETLSICIDLLKELRKRSFWQNNMEFVKLIDERIRLNV